MIISITALALCPVCVYLCGSTLVWRCTCLHVVASQLHSWIDTLSRVSEMRYSPPHHYLRKVISGNNTSVFRCIHLSHLTSEADVHYRVYPMHLSFFFPQSLSLCLSVFMHVCVIAHYGYQRATWRSWFSFHSCGSRSHQLTSWFFPSFREISDSCEQLVLSRREGPVRTPGPLCARLCSCALPIRSSCQQVRVVTGLGSPVCVILETHQVVLWVSCRFSSCFPSFDSSLPSMLKPLFCVFWF